MSNYKIKDRQLSEDFVLPVEKGGRVNPNLLHNWYFGNPVNRNGKTEYNKSGWNIDRWYASISTGGSVNLIDDAIQIIGGTNNTSFRQYVDVPIAEAYTCSFLCEITGGMAYMQTFYTDGTAGKYIYTASNGLFSFTDTSQKQINRVQFGVEAGVTLTLYACKLELGDTQTLAHQNEEGNWVLNEIPDFGEQYAICCQYDKTSGEYLGLTPEAIGARPSTWMPSANDVGALKVYTSFSELGLSEATATAKSVVNAMANNSILLVSCSLTPTDTALKFPVRYGLFRVIKVSNYYAEFSYNGNSGGNLSGSYGIPYVGFYNEASGNAPWTGWVELPDASKFLPLDGSVPMSGDLKFGNGTGKIASNVDLSILSHNNKDGSSSYISIEDEANGVLATRLKYVHKGTGYPIFGKHNTELLASTIQSLIGSGAINVPAVKSVQRGVITIAKGSVSGSATISSVNTSKAVVVFGGFGMNYEDSMSYSAFDQSHPYLTLTSATQVTASRNASISTIVVKVPYQVIEYT